MTEPQKPKHAATVILLRRGARTGFEVFLTRRPEGMPFLGGMYCFPGGTVRKEDRSPAMVQRCHGLTPSQARRILGAYLTPPQALGFWVAASRELFEEAGVLLATRVDGERISLDTNTTRSLAEKQASSKRAVSFQSLLESEQLYCDLSRLTYLSHWQTPSRQPIRFDTRFFLATLPEGQSALSSSDEVVHSLWLTPDRALSLCEKKELPMIFPTFASLRTLADFDSLESLLREYCLKVSS